MRPIKEILASGDANEIYRKLTSRKKPFEKPFERTEREWNPLLHQVMDTNVRKKKRIKEATDKIDPQTGKPVYRERQIDRCRVCIPIQQTIVERTVGFLFANRVEYMMESKENEKTKRVYDGVMKIFNDNKIKFFDKKLARHLFRARECAELWYFILDENGKPTKDMRVKLLSPVNGDMLFPHFDNYERMDGFARKYTVADEDNNTKIHFDVYTDTLVYNYVYEGGSLVLQGSPKRHGFEKVPVIYYRQEHTEWDKVQIAIDRVEELISNWGDTNDYFGTPSYFFKGKLKGFAEKGEVGKIYQGEGESDMRVLSWDNSPASVTGELANLMNIIFSYTQTPDISFETMKTLGNNTSGVSIKLMFTDPHMKADVKTELFGEMFTRRFNLVMSGYGSIIEATPQSVIDSINIEPIFKPYLPENTIEKLQLINASTGGKATMSQEEGVRQNPLVKNPDTVLQQLQAEAQASAMMDSFGMAQ